MIGIEKGKEYKVLLKGRTITQGVVEDFNDEWVLLKRQVDLDGSGRFHLFAVSEIVCVEWDYEVEKKEEEAVN